MDRILLVTSWAVKLVKLVRRFNRPGSVESVELGEKFDLENILFHVTHKASQKSKYQYINII